MEIALVERKRGRGERALRGIAAGIEGVDQSLAEKARDRLLTGRRTLGRRPTEGGRVRHALSLAVLEPAGRHVPAGVEADRPRRAGLEREGHRKRRAGRAVGHGRIVHRAARRHVVPRKRQRVPPAAAEPAVVDRRVRVVHEASERARILAVLARLGVKRETAPDQANGPGVAHEVARVEREDRAHRLVGRVGEAIFQRARRQRRAVRVGRREGAPAGQLDGQRHGRVAQRDGGEGKTRHERALAKARETVGTARSAVARTALTEIFPIGDRAFNHARDVLLQCLAEHADGGEAGRFVEKLHAVAHRHLGNRARAFEAVHARAEPADGERHAVQIRAFVRPVERPRTGGSRHHEEHDACFHSESHLLWPTNLRK